MHNWKTMQRGALVILLALSLTLSACQGLSLIGRQRPNIIVILTDDLDWGLMPYMPQTHELITTQGVTFQNYFITTPLCCPSRTSILTGRYAHNTDILDNLPAFKRFFQRGEETETLAVWLDRAGYDTAMVGKYLNLYPIDAGRNYVPPGWTDWHAFLYERGSEDFYFNYQMNENGEFVQYADSPEEYSTDVIRERSSTFIDQSLSRDVPFFLLVSVYAPHGPATPAPRHADMFSDLEYPKGPSFKEADTTDKPGILWSLVHPGDDFDAGDADNFMRQRARSMQAVDELVGELVSVLEKQGGLENTYILFTSDNGFRNGEHDLATGKGLPYEEDIRVPLMIRGPGIEPGATISQMAANIDLASTIAGMAGIRTADFVDGRSLMPLIHLQPGESLAWRNGLLIEGGYWDELPAVSVQAVAFSASESQLEFFQYLDAMDDESLRQIGNIAYRGFRTAGFKYMEYNSGELEFYDLIDDPYELENLASAMDPAVLSRLHSWLVQLQTCSAEDCRRIEMQLPAELAE